MTRRRKPEGKHTVVQAGANRGGRGFVAGVPRTAAAALARWSVFDTKEGRAEELTEMIHAQFPGVRTDAHHADGRNALNGLAQDAVIVSTVDTIEDTRALVESREESQALCFQLVGRGPGGSALSAERFGFSGVVRNAAEQASAELLLDGFSTFSAPASSRALTAAGDPMSAAMLQPLRTVTTRQTTRYFADAVDARPSTEHPLTFFTSAGQYPLVVVSDRGDLFSVQKAQALAALDALVLRRVGIVAVVAVVAIDERCIHFLFVSRSHEDLRRVIGVAHFRAPVQRTVSLSPVYGTPAVLTD